MPKDQSYHEAAIVYNEALAECAENLAPTLSNEIVQKWCISVGKQHRFHAKRHRSALNKFLLKKEAAPVEVIGDGLDVPEPVDEPKNKSDDFDDGCIGFHNPQTETCEFYPRGEVNG